MYLLFVQALFCECENDLQLLIGKDSQEMFIQVRVRIKIPKKLSNEEKSLIKKLREIEENKTHVGPFTF